MVAQVAAGQRAGVRASQDSRLVLVKVAEPAGRRTQATHDSRKLRFVWDLGTCQCARKPHTCLPEMATWLAKTGGQ